MGQRFPNQMVVHLNAIRKPSSFAAQNGVIVEARMSIVTVQIALITERVQKVNFTSVFFVSIYSRLHVSIQEDILITYEFIITHCHHMQTQVQLKTRKNISLRQYDNFIVYNTLIFVDYNINMVMRSLDSNH